MTQLPGSVLLYLSRMTDSVVKCVTEPCVVSCSDVKLMVYPPPLCLTIPGLRLQTDPGQCLIEKKTSCLTNGSDGCSPEVVTKSSVLRAISGESTPCSVISCPDSHLIIHPPAVCITLPGAKVASFPNECLIETSPPCGINRIQPQALTGSTSVSDCSLTPDSFARSPCGLKPKPPCVIQGSGEKVIIHPAPITLTIPGNILKVAADECVVEVYRLGESNSSITNGECDVKSVRVQLHPCNVEDDSSCVTQGQDVTMVIHPPAFQLDLPGPIIKSFPESCVVDAVCPSTPRPAVQSGCEPQALCSSAATSPSFSNMSCTMKRPLPDIRRPARPWCEMYNRSMTPRSVMAQQTPFSRYRNGY